MADIHEVLNTQPPFDPNRRVRQLRESEPVHKRHEEERDEGFASEHQRQKRAVDEEETADETEPAATAPAEDEGAASVGSESGPVEQLISDLDRLRSIDPAVREQRERERRLHGRQAYHEDEE